MVPRFHLIEAAALVLLSSACSPQVTRQAPGVAPTPQTITKDAPGGDAHDPRRAALSRLTGAQWGWRPDKDRQARFPLPDYSKWTRVRFALIEHFTGFRYGKEGHALTVAFLVPLEKDDERTSEKCIERFEEQSLPTIERFGGQLSGRDTTQITWRKVPVVVRSATGKVDFLFQHYEAALSYAAYPAYADSCLVYAIAVRAEEHPADAHRLRDRWLEGLPQFRPMTEEEPYRH